MAAPTEHQFRPALRLFELVSLGVGGTIGSGIFVVPGVAAGLAGAASLWVWAAVAVVAGAVAASLAALQSRAPGGSAYTELFEDAFGAPAALCLVVLYLVSAVFGIATIAAGLGQYIAHFGAIDVRTVEVAIVAALLLLNLGGIVLSGRAENVLSVAKLAGLAAIVVVLAPHVDTGNLVAAEPVPVSAFIAAAILVFWPFTGFEISAIPVAEMRDPRQIPCALALVVALVCLTYLVLNVSLIGAIGAADLAASPTPLATATGRFVPGADTFVVVLGVVTMLSALNAYIVAASRVLQNAAARIRIAPLAVISPRGVPAAALTLSCAAASAMLFASNRFDTLATYAVLATLVPYVAVCLAAAITIDRTSARAIGGFGAAATLALLALYFLT